ncbi:phosphoesterase [Cellulophaga sp. F20128]|uniref:metallophosphoesterase n=1 Tax=Cellulophaga sp. F20128 TaxID=2926413 RepID=UPI001FF64E59|nr:metallophosphoesterase [Cellulophaga sp. F20128]MCK0156626.1 phosphoesterase [Cellulophaga sp. F20128]
MKNIILLILLCIGCKTNTKKNIETAFEIGIIADCQYCNCDASNTRFYTGSLAKLKTAVDTLNTKELAYTIHLGDFIDRDYESFDSVLPIWNRLTSKKQQVLGNHDFSVADSLKKLVPGKMGLKSRYYSFLKNNWRFIVLDGNDLSFYGAISDKKRQQTDSLFNELKDKKIPNLQTWNGGISLAQLNWVKEELEIAVVQNEKVGFYCHFPAVKEGEVHNLWNYKQLLQLIDNYEQVKFYFNGHNHHGAYEEKNGVHHLTFKGMVDTEKSTAFSTATITKDSIFITGYGREKSRRLKIK